MTWHGYSRPMTVLSRGARARRGGRRPGWALLTVLLILAIGASCALVFTDRVELLRLAVLLALWAAVVAAFVSVIYRRQSDTDAAKVRDLKHVYDLQLDREISARREYELSVEAHLRRELSAELRAQQADEVAALRAELAALRTNLEILFDTDLAHRPALETDRSYQPPKPDRVASSRIYPETPPEPAESPIIDVPEEPLTQQSRGPEDGYRGSHRRLSDETTWIPPVRPGPPPQVSAPPPPTPRPAPPQERQQERQAPRPVPRQAPPTQQSAPTPAPEPKAPPVQKAPPEPQVPPAPPVQKAPPEPQPEHTPEPPRRGRHSGTGGADDADAGPEVPRGRHYAPAAEVPTAPPSRHRGPDSEDESASGGQSVAELLARLQAANTGSGGRRRRRED
ncbi:conserved alanine, arginine and proline rich membrane protein [Mycolicibacterium tokaiense]|uniref:Conserved alanine, arginine and proline rich membrane protein n=2 Tax=Mycolicibacterium tokaiense TaxID=39695 RepID=A0A378THT5_9MYCO|nr:hypothetical protein MTOK_21470 [Mycolicibacterium tokaiense]STZ59126.1 conserved alanine, arginine and proline rich membrane protein [Mycolicibacterium tokaiense]